MQWTEKTVGIQQLNDSLFEQKGITVSVLREDLLHPDISGNKWRKLKYNLMRAEQKQCKAMLTFGGAFSNHIAATAAAGKTFGFKTIGIIRGEEADLSNPTLAYALVCGMEIYCVSRAEYERKNETAYRHELRQRFGNIWIVPEGGSNYEGVNGCTEILGAHTQDFNKIAVSCGTGTTTAGVALSLQSHQQLLGFPALKGKGYLRKEVFQHLKWFLMDDTLAEEYLEDVEFNEDYHFGGFGKMDPTLVQFMNNFYQKHGFRLDGLYTGKMFFGLYELIQADSFQRGDKLLVIHTGGLQGNKGLERRYGIHFD